MPVYHLAEGYKFPLTKLSWGGEKDCTYLSHWPLWAQSHRKFSSAIRTEIGGSCAEPEVEFWALDLTVSLRHQYLVKSDLVFLSSHSNHSTMWGTGHLPKWCHWSCLWSLNAAPMDFNGDPSRRFSWGLCYSLRAQRFCLQKLTMLLIFPSTPQIKSKAHI